MYIDELNMKKKDDIIFFVKEKYLKELELNCKIFVWWNGDLEYVILSLNKWKIFEVFYLIEYEIIEDMLEKIVNVG